MEKVKFNEIPIDITQSEYKMLKENLKLFNRNSCKGSELTFDEFVSLVFETIRLEETLNSKYDYLKILKAEIKQIEAELSEKYAIGLTGPENNNKDIIKLRKQALKDSSDYIYGLY